MEQNTNNDSSFNGFLDQYIQKLNDILIKFVDLRKIVENHHYSCNVAKTAGTAVSGAGVAAVVSSVLLAPVTSGSSLAMGAGGAVLSVTGGISNVITDYVDYRTSSSIMADIESIVKSKEEFDENLRKRLDNFGMFIEEFMKSGMDRDQAIEAAVKAVAVGCIDLTQEPNMNLMNTINTVMKLHHIEKAAIETLPIIGKTMHMSEKSLQLFYNIFGLTSKTVPQFLKTVGRITTVVSVAFTIVDVALLIRDWTTEHPSIEVIEDVERKIQEEKSILLELLWVIEASGDKEVVLNKALDDIKYIEDEEDRELLKSFVIV